MSEKEVRKMNGHAETKPHKKGNSRKGAGSRKGQAIVEFALALPLLLTILCGILDFGWIYSNQYKVEYASYAGARYAATNVMTVSSAELDYGVSELVADNLPGDGKDASIDVSVGSDTVSVSVTYPVRTLTFVAGTAFGRYYNARSTSVAVY